MATWPGTLPQVPLDNGFQEKPVPNVDAFVPEKGAPITRPTYTGRLRVYEIGFHFTAAQRLTFWTFWETTLGFGALSFDWTHPVDSGTETWKFDPAQVPVFVPVSGDLDLCRFRLMQLPS